MTYFFKDSDRRLILLIVCAIILVTFFHFYAIGRNPSYPSDDDGAYAAAGYQIWLTGKPGVSGYKGVAKMGENIYVLGHIGSLLQGICMRIFGISISTALFPSFLTGVASLGFLFLLGRKLWGATVGILAVLLLSLSGVFFAASHSARPDLLVTLFFLIALWLVASASVDNQFWRLFFAGLVMGFSGDVHPNGFLLLPLPFAFWTLLRSLSWKQLRISVLAYGLGGLLGIGYWLTVHYWPDPTGFRYQSSIHGLATHGVKILDHGLFGSLLIESQRYLNWFWNARGHRHLLEGIFIALSAMLLLWKGGRIGRAVVGTWALFFLIASAFMSNSFGWYLIFAWPLFALWMAKAIELIEWNWLSRTALALIVTAYLFNLGLWQWKANQEIPMKAWVPELRAAIPANEPVFASAGLWFAFWDRNYTHEPYLPFREIEATLYPETGPTGWEVEQRKLGWRYIAAYGNLRRMLDPEVPVEQMLAVDPWRNRADEVLKARNFSLKNCTVVTRFRSQDETITVLKINDISQIPATNLP
ncbi:MAG TPA: glycosyltransferase family 39 protein [Blastocatellia bacterium]|nr:glycosyltransferase family 39 protein [Blastocatellia bacterium]